MSQVFDRNKSRWARDITWWREESTDSQIAGALDEYERRGKALHAANERISALERDNAALREALRSAPVAHFRWCQDDAQGCDCPSRNWLLKRKALLAEQSASAQQGGDAK